MKKQQRNNFSLNNEQDSSSRYYLNWFIGTSLKHANSFVLFPEKKQLELIRQIHVSQTYNFFSYT